MKVGNTALKQKTSLICVWVRAHLRLLIRQLSQNRPHSCYCIKRNACRQSISLNLILWKNYFFSRTSLFITCSGLYGIFLVVFCVSLLATEIATHSVPLHYFEVRQIQGCQKLYFLNSNDLVAKLEGNFYVPTLYNFAL